MKNYNSKFKIFTFLIVILIFTFLFLNLVFAATNISSNNFEHWAWNDVIGWIDFYSTNNVNVSSQKLSGYATSSVGYIALDCNNSPNGNICATSDFKVSNDGSGNLSGWAWNDAIGWISFTCDHTSDGTSPPDNVNTCGTSNYQVAISGANGDFSGWAWNDIVGWISFNCNNSGIGNTCGASNYKVNTTWRAAATTAELVSAIFDTQVLKGAAPNAILWRGTKPTGTTVKFQIASSNSSSGPWNFIGPEGTSGTYYEPTGPDTPIQINLAYHNNQRYIRYKVILVSDVSQTASPKVDDVIINWSP